MAFTRVAELEIQSGQISGTLSNFRAIVILTHNDLRSVGSGGYMQNSSGFDLRFFSDEDLTIALTYYLLEYKPASGRIAVVVLIPSAANGTVIYAGFGDTSLSSDGSNVAAFTANCKSFVRHADNAGVLVSTDLVQAATGTNIGNVAPTAGVDLSVASVYDGNGDRVQYGTGGIVTSNKLTVGVLANPAATTRGDMVTRWVSGGGDSQFDLLKGISSAKPQFFIARSGGTSSSGVGSSTMSNGTWYMIHGRFTGTVTSVWMNGVKEAEASTSVTLNTTSTSALRLGDNSNSDGDFNGSLGIAYVDDVDRSDAWLGAEYRAYLTPGSFWGATFGAPPSTGAKAAHYYYSGAGRC